MTMVEAVSEAGYGLNGRRPKLLKLLANPEIQTIVVEHRERLMGFGAEYVEAALAAQGRKLMLMESSEVKDDLVEDMIEVLTWFCARLYGRRSAPNKARKALQAMEQ
jgi:predicted site-specific integrase-resolvase